MRKLSIRIIIALHALWTIIVLLCLPIALLFPSSHVAILFFIGFTLVAQIPTGKCPFTIFENKLRGHAAYPETFMRHYLKRVFDVDVSDRVLFFITMSWFVVVILVSIFYKLHQAF